MGTRNPHLRDAGTWEKINDVVLMCGNVHSPKMFAAEILKNLQALCPFDQALTYFLDGNGKVCSQYLLNINEQWSTMYLEYYANLDGQQYSLRCPRENTVHEPVHMRDWAHEPSSEFVSDYIRARGLKYSVGFGLYDLNGIQRAVFALDRTTDDRFNDDDLLNLALVVPHLNNLHKNFYYQQTKLNPVTRISWETTNLTPREVEIANLLCQGVSPSNISRSLYISLPTTYKHISHIYEKMHVSSRQELLVRLLRHSN